MEFPAATLALYLVDFSLNKCSGWNDYLVAGGYGRGGLSVDVISTMDVSGLDRLGEHESDPGSSGNGYGGGFWRSVGGCDRVLGCGLCWLSCLWSLLRKAGRG